MWSLLEKCGEKLQEKTQRKNFKQGKHMQVNIMVCVGEWLDII